jgi:hypothetical protein
MPPKVLAFNANGISKQRYELSKQLQDLRGSLFRDTSKTPLEVLHSKLPIYRINRHPERKGGTAVAVRKGIPHKHVDLPPLPFP